MTFKHILTNTLCLALIVLFASCSKDKTAPSPNELDNYQLAATLSNTQHIIQLYTANGKFQTGYNAVLLQVSPINGSPFSNLTAEWTPVMHMMGMTHSCPVSPITKKANAQVTYQGYMVFQMAGNETEYWELILDYEVGGTAYSANARITVGNTEDVVVSSFEGTNGKRYVLALVEPAAPKVALNPMTAVLYQMNDMMDFSVVDDYTIEIDPRMPGMANHSSPNNVHLTQGTDGLYRGTLSLTMTGYWKISLLLKDAEGTVLKGEPITETNESSSLFFEVEF